MALLAYNRALKLSKPGFPTRLPVSFMILVMSLFLNSDIDRGTSQSQDFKFFCTTLLSFINNIKFAY